MALFTLSNNSVKLVVVNTGAALHQLWVKDSNGDFVNVVVGLPNEDAYKDNPWYRGTIVGRYAGRLTNPLDINGRKYILKNTKENIVLHSGPDGWSHQYWEIDQIDAQTLRCKLQCKSKKVGLPGHINAVVHYRLLEHGIEIDYLATTDQETLINLTNHAYFNLDGGGTMDAHQLQINASHYLDLDDRLVPTGQYHTIEGTPMDFGQMRPLKNQFLDDFYIGTSPKIARLKGGQKNIEMQVITDQPGTVIFRPRHFEALCIETQAPPKGGLSRDMSPTLAGPNRPYRQKTQFLFQSFQGWTNR